jgi:uncharacterized Tic20 family protein
MSDEILVPSNDEKNIATFTHLGGTVFSFIPALIIWALKKDESPYLAIQAKEALNFQITILMAQLAASVLYVILIGFVITGVVWVINIVFCILAAIATSKSENYTYPISLRLIN